MLKYVLLSFFLTLNLWGQSQNIYSFELESMTGDKIPLQSFKGKPLFIVNIATHCGFTPQLKGLQKLSKIYKSKGLVVLGVPSNDFGGQTPESNSGVEKFCKDTYGVTFPLTKKTIVSGVKKHSLFVHLTKKGGEILWNFEKFLIDKKGHFIKRFRSDQTPLSKDVLKAIDEVF